VKDGTIYWLAPDLAVRREQKVAGRVLGLALDSFGGYLAISTNNATVELSDCTGRSCFRVSTPRPLHHLAFLAEAPFVIGCADYGLVLCLDLKGNVVWRDGPVSHIGSLAVNGDGTEIVLACFTDGLRRYDGQGKPRASFSIAETCRLATMAYDGSIILVAGLGQRLLLLDSAGRVKQRKELDDAPRALAIGPLGDYAVVAQSGGPILCIETT
jgi:hypothetical protein